MALTSPPKSHFLGESTFTLVAQTLAPDRPNELKCFNIAFGGGDWRIQITPGGVKAHPGTISRFVRGDIDQRKVES